MMTNQYTTSEQALLGQLLLDGKVSYGDSNFATSLVHAKNPSSKQMDWVRKLIERTTQSGLPRRLSAYGDAQIDMTHINSMFDTARQNLKRPKITLLLNNDVSTPVKFSFNRSKTYLYMNSERWGQCYGIIEVSTGGVQLKQFGRAHKDALVALLVEFAKAPQALAIQHGKLSGNCCFCSLKLTDPRSTHHGYGHRCARNYRLPWGEKGEAATQVGDWVFGKEPTK